MPFARSQLRAAALALALLVGGARAAMAQQGTVTGRVAEAGTGQPVASVQVFIVGTTLGGLTNQDGRFTIRGVPAGPQTLRALRIGYQEVKRSITVAAGQTQTVDLTLNKTVVELTPVVTTATGEQRRVEIGNAVSTIQAAKVAETAPIRTVQDLLNSRAPGVIVTTGTQTGAGSRIRIRGTNSISLSNDPIFVIDGIRMTSNVNSSSLFTGGAQPSRVSDIDPQDIESIEIVKGPSAATLYGTDAANGVVVITTKRGRAGATQWNFFGEGGVLTDRHTYPTAYTIFGKQTGQTNQAPLNFCNLPRVAAGTCSIDSVASYSPFADPDVTPIGLGYRSQVGGQLSGGTESVRYFLSGDREDETGVLRLPDFERRRFDSTGTVIREWVARPNALGKNNVRANLNASVGSKLDLAVSSAFINLAQRFTTESNATVGLGSQIFGGPGCKICNPDRTVSGTGTPLYGYRAWTPGYTFQEKNAQRVNRFIGSASANWRPTSWWQNRINVGNDLTDRVDDNLLFRGEGPPITATYRNGFKENARTDIRNFTADLGSTASWAPRPSLNLKTTAGVQYVNYLFEQNDASATDLPPGTQTASAGANKSASEATTLQKTLGFFLEEQAAIRDRLFLTAAVRSDQNSAFGTNFQRVFYPKLSLSWLVSEEGFFPQVGWLNSLRLRSAYGASGVQPGPNDALRFLAAATANIRGTDQPAVLQSAIGNLNLKPERSAEFEAGFETRLFSSRVSLDVTYYNKRTRDALVSAIIPPSAGSGGTTVRRNLGAVRNTGWELSSNAQVVDTRNFGFDFTLNASTNDNKVLDLGGVPPIIGVTNRVVQGYPIWGLWAVPITGWEDKNKDGILTYSADPAKNEVFVGDSAVFRGYPQPRYTATLTPGIDLFNKRLRLTSLFDYRGGHLWYNNTERIRCVSRQNCSGLMNPNSSFEDQAMVVATRDNPAKTLDGFFQKGDFVKWREASAQLSLSPELASRFRARSMSLVFTARQLKTWTKYRGVDPESDYVATTGSDTPSEFQTLAPPSYFILRLNLGF